MTIMNNNYMKAIIVGVLLLAGCKKGLDLVPLDTISDATFWKTPADFKLAANNLYLSLPDFKTDPVMDGNSDIEFSVPNTVSNGTYQVPIDDTRWSSPYTYIRRCNTIIEKASTSPIAADIKQFVAEAKFFRAYNYWELFRLYGGVPIITKALDIDSKELYDQRATRQETVDFILKDLTEAAADLPEQKSLAAADIGRSTKGAANALKARVALFEGTWGKFHGGDNMYLTTAIEAAKAVMNSGQYALYSGNGEQSYRYLFIDQGENSSEGILDVRYKKDILDHLMTYYIIIGDHLPTKKLADMYLCDDGLPIAKSPLFQGYNTRISEFQNRDPRMTMTIVTPGKAIPQNLYPKPEVSWPFYPQRNANTGYITYKYVSEDSLSNARGRYDFGLRVIRYAEVLLTYAEAVFEKNEAISDEDLNKSINLIRARANMPPLTNAFVAANGLDMREEIRRERTIEMALEGFRFDDLRRWKTAETELPQDIRGIKIVGTQWTDPIIQNGANRNPYAGASWQNNTDAGGFIIAEKGRSFNTNKNYLMPLPSKEILINKDLQQNPNW